MAKSCRVQPRSPGLVILQADVFERLGVGEIVAMALGGAAGFLGPLLDHRRGIPVAHLALMRQQARHFLFPEAADVYPAIGLRPAANVYFFDVVCRQSLGSKL